MSGSVHRKINSGDFANNGRTDGTKTLADQGQNQVGRGSTVLAEGSCS